MQQLLLVSFLRVLSHRSYCCAAWARGFDRVLTVTSSPNSQFHGAEGQALGPGVSVMDEWEECGQTNPCTIEPQLDATFLVRSHDIAGIWVAFFSRCLRYRCGQGTANERTGDHQLTLAGDAHVEADGVHCMSETLSGVSALHL